MSLFENKLLSSHHPRLSHHVTYWHRYVDDVQCLWEGSLPFADDVRDLINSCFPSIEFIMKIDGLSINFLEFTIRIANVDHTFSTYRKA